MYLSFTNMQCDACHSANTEGLRRTDLLASMLLSRPTGVWRYSVILEGSGAHRKGLGLLKRVLPLNYSRNQTKASWKQMHASLSLLIFRACPRRNSSCSVSLDLQSMAG